MIKLTKLNGDEFVLNSDLIRTVECRPDTYITLTTDERIIVRESTSEVVHRVMAFSRACRLMTSIRD